MVSLIMAVIVTMILSPLQQSLLYYLLTRSGGWF